MNVINRKALAIGAHPDDIEYGCGGYIQRMESAFLVMSCSDEIRKRECANSAGLLNVDDLNCEKFSDRNLEFYDRKLIECIESKIDSINPNVIITHFPRDTHQDHRSVSNAVISACRDFAGTILFYRSPSSIDFSPNFFVELSIDEWVKKIKAINCHKSQTDSKSYLSNESLEAAFSFWITAYRGIPCYREPFYIYRHVE